jgi:hypothetical protein
MKICNPILAALSGVELKLTLALFCYGGDVCLEIWIKSTPSGNLLLSYVDKHNQIIH